MGRCMGTTIRRQYGADDPQDLETNMTAVLPDRPALIEPSEEDQRVAVGHALERAEVTFEELQSQAMAGRFDSLRARLAWMAVKDLGHLTR